MGLKEIRTRLTEEKIRRDNLLEDISNTRKELKSNKIRYHNSLKAHSLLQSIAKELQSQLETYISSSVSTALSIVFENPWKFIARFEKKNGKTECTLLFDKDGDESKPIDCSGGGPLDIASFALRVAFLSLSTYRKIIVLDEPFKFLSRNLQYKASLMLKILSQKLNLQFIVVSHIDDIIEDADRVFIVESGNIKQLS